MEGTPKKRVVRKRVKKNDAELKVIKKAVSSKKTLVKPKKAVKKKVIEKPFFADDDSEEVVLVTGSLSQRLEEKKLAYELWFKDQSPSLLRPIALSSGYAFIVAGILLTVLILEPFNLKPLVGSAALPCASQNCEEMNTGDSVSALFRPSVTFEALSVVDSGSDVSLRLTVENAKVDRLELVSLSQPFTEVLAVKEDKLNNYSYDLPLTRLKPGDYFVRAVVSHRIDELGQSLFAGPVFSIPESDEIVDIVVAEKIEIEPQGEVLGMSTTTEELVIAEQDNSTTSTVVIEEEEKEDETPKEVKDFTFVAETNEDQTQTIFKVGTIFAYDRLTLYAKPAESDEFLLLGLATAVNNNWYYWLDNNELPSGEYSIIIKATENNELKSEAEFRFVNAISNLSKVTTAALDGITGSIESELGTSEDVTLAKETRSSYFENYLNSLSSTSENSLVQEELSGARNKLNQLFQIYAATEQTKSLSLKALVEERINIAINDEISSVDNDLLFAAAQKLVTELKETVIASEAEFANISETKSSIDLDLDGISDYDEVTVFSTDPTIPDTDVDGYNDGIEIASGYNPLTEVPETLYLANNVSGNVLANPDVFIQTIEPVYMYTAASSTPLVLSMISGRAIPNSYIKINLPTEKLVAQVKVGNDGVFSYFLNYELKEGDHLASILYTNNSGKIIERSADFAFNLHDKDIAKLTESIIQSSEPAFMDDGEKEIFMGKNLLGAIGVVAFGLVLLLLGNAIPRRKQGEVGATA